MKKTSLILLFLGVFLLPIMTKAAITGDACSLSDYNASFSTETTIDYSGSLNTTEGTTFHFTIQVAGTLTLTPSSAAGKIKMAYSTTSCPTTASSDSAVSIIVTETTDINVLLYNPNSPTTSYDLEVVFTPAPMALLKTVYPAQVAEETDTNVTYSLILTNNTDSDISTPIITDILPDGVTLLDIDYPSDWTCTETQTIVCSSTNIPPLLAANDEIKIDFDVTVNSDSDIYNTATVQAVDENEVSSTAIIRAVSGAQTVDLELQKYAQADTIPPDTNFSYVIFVINHDPSDAELVRVTDDFPLDQNVTFFGVDESTGWTCTTPTEANSTFVCDYNQTLEGREITYFTIDAKTNAGDYNTTAVNTATVSALNPISGDHNLTDTAVINIETNATASGALQGKYVEGGSIEVSDLDLPLNTNRNNAIIRTKVASTGPMTLNTYFVDYETDLTTTYESNATKVIPVTVLLKLGDDECNYASETYLSYDGSPVAVVFEEHDYMKQAGSDPQNDVNTFTLRNIAQKKARLIMKYVDINKEIDYSGETCSVSNLSSNIKGLPQCIANSAGSSKFDNNKYINVFGIDAFIRCNLQNGSPCSSENNGAGDAPYDHPYGCYECTVGSDGYCSNDNFAIRPKAFDVNITNGDILRAGKDYSLSFKGLTANTSMTDETTLDYNETQDSSFAIDANVSDNAKCQIKYLTLTPSVAFQNGLDNGPFRFDDIGDINFSVHEIENNEFALVDENDTNDTLRLIEDFNITFSVIPDHFEITAALTDHNDASNLTYLHDIHRYDIDDNYEMGANLDINITAVGENNNTTRNYTQECYAKDTNLSLGLNGTDIIYPGTEALTHFLYYNPLEDDNSTNGGEGNYTLPAAVSTTYGNTISFDTLPIENIKSSFPENAPDGNGTTYITYKLNFNRKMHLVVNPIQMILSDVNITEVDANITNPNNLVRGETGTLSDQNATFYYARSRASKFFYEDITEANATTPILIDVYCDLGFVTCDNFGINTVNGAINEPNWWLSLGHNETTYNDGNITLIINLPDAIIEGNTGDSPTVDTDVTINTQAQDSTIEVRSNTLNLPMTVLIDLDQSNPTDTNHWLIYNPDDEILAPSPFYKVRFIGDSSWTGEGETGYIVDVNASLKKHKKMDW